MPRTLKPTTVRTGSELRATLADGLAARSTVETQANPISSRSHAICVLRFLEAGGHARGTTLRLVDLAGSVEAAAAPHLTER